MFNKDYLIVTPWSKVLVEKWTVTQLVKKFPILRNTNIHYDIDKRPTPVPLLSYVNPVQASPSHFLSIIFYIILPSMSLSSKGSISIRVFYKNSVCTPSIPHTCHMPYSPPGMITRTLLSEEYRPLSYSSCGLLHPSFSLSLLDPNILNTLFSNTLSLRSSLYWKDQVSHPYKTTGKIIVIYILIFRFFDSKLEDKYFAPNNSKNSNFNLLLNFFRIEFWFFKVSNFSPPLPL
jgi:hypothetical protein